MSVSDGQRVNAAVSNAAWLSRITNSDTVAVIGLNEPGSGGLIGNAQQKINDNTAAIVSNDTDISDLQSQKQDLGDKGLANGYAALDPKAQLLITPITFAGTASQVDSNVTGLIFDSLEYDSATVTYSIKTATLFERGTFDVLYDGTNWDIYSGNAVGDDSLITFSSIDATTGQVKYTSDVETSAMKFTYEGLAI